MEELFKLQEEKLPKTTSNDNLKISSSETLKIENNEKPKEKPKEEINTNLVELKISYNFQANPSDIYECLTNPQRISVYTRSAAIIEPKAGGKFVFL